MGVIAEMPQRQRIEAGEVPGGRGWEEVASYKYVFQFTPGLFRDNPVIYSPGKMTDAKIAQEAGDLYANAKKLNKMGGHPPIIKSCGFSKLNAELILDYLGGSTFLRRTGCKNLQATSRGVKFDIPRNRTRANLCWIEMNRLDLFDMRFYKQTRNSLVKSGQGLMECYIKNIDSGSLSRMFCEATGLCG